MTCDAFSATSEPAATYSIASLLLRRSILGQAAVFVRLTHRIMAFPDMDPNEAIEKLARRKPRMSHMEGGLTRGADRRDPAQPTGAEDFVCGAHYPRGERCYRRAGPLGPVRDRRGRRGSQLSGTVGHLPLCGSGAGVEDGLRSAVNGAILSSMTPRSNWGAIIGHWMETDVVRTITSDYLINEL